MFLMGAGTEAINSVRPVWPRGCTAVDRPTAPATGLTSQRHLFAIGGGLVDDVAASGWARYAGHGGSAGGARGVGGRPAPGETGTGGAGVEQHGRAEPCPPAVAADGRGNGLRSDLHDVDGRSAKHWVASETVPAGWVLPAVGAHRSTGSGLPAGEQCSRRSPLASDPDLDGSSPEQWVGGTPVLGAHVRGKGGERTRAGQTDN